jgi:hypothetical protein
MVYTMVSFIFVCVNFRRLTDTEIFVSDYYQFVPKTFRQIRPKGGYGLWCFSLMPLNNISVISRWSVLLVDESGVAGENHRPATSHRQSWYLKVFIVGGLISVYCERCWSMFTLSIPFANLCIIVNLFVFQGPLWSWMYDSWIYNYLCNTQ